jgi:hypothetical protein
LIDCNFFHTHCPQKKRNFSLEAFLEIVREKLKLFTVECIVICATLTQPQQQQHSQPRHNFPTWMIVMSLS